MIDEIMLKILATLERIEQHLADKPKRSKSKPGSSVLADAYKEAFRSRYPVEPVRNASTAGMLSAVAKRIPQEDHAAIAHFFIKQNDAWYIREMHHPRCLLKDCENLLTRMKSGLNITPGKAQMISRAAENSEALESYRRGKWQGEKSK